jgi:cell division protein FtsB
VISGLCGFRGGISESTPLKRRPARVGYPARLVEPGGGELRRIAWVPIALGLGIVLALADGRAGLRAWWMLRSDVSSARERVAALQLEIQELRGHQEALGSSPFAIEQAIRQDLELARPGEVVVRVPLDADPSSR